MIEIKIPKDIREYKEKVFLDMSLRQAGSIVLAAAVGIPAYFLLKKNVGDDAAGWTAIIIGIGLGLFGFYKKNGLTFEKYLMKVFSYYVYPNKRKYTVIDMETKWIENERKELAEEINMMTKKKKKSRT